ncbi:immunoglobulin lambda-1 light chain-like [Protopterus annectens]|uniref:immunoglobulin lambda-1 light chain-like n=1 Tax=Protopterus annectens TaxID=7888 RepID=UPI001CF9D460|nr:immunoglobulin lambda-1 light chain-like [Protopterus annectens]
MFYRSIFVILFLRALDTQPVQFPPSVKVSTGQSVTLSCNIVNGPTYCQDIEWYILQHPKIFRHLKSDNKSSVLRGVEERNCALTIKDLERNYSGTYFCSACNAFLSAFGNGTKLIVSNEKMVIPSVTILTPSAEEIVIRNKVTLICLVYGATFQQIIMFWNISGKITSGLIEPVEGISKANYSIRNQLTIPAVTWNNGNNCTCVVESESGHIVMASIWKGIRRKL